MPEISAGHYEIDFSSSSLHRWFNRLRAVFLFSEFAMGSRGPQPLPSNVHHLRNNPSKKPAIDLLDDFQPEVEIPDCPSFCWPAAKKEWKRITPLLERDGLIALIDRASLTLYVQAWAEYVWHKQRLTADRARAEKGRQEAEAKGEVWAGGDGVMVPTANGNFTYSHHWVAARQAAREVSQFIAKFGGSPSDRSRVKVSDNRQSSLFEAPGEDQWKL